MASRKLFQAPLIDAIAIDDQSSDRLAMSTFHMFLIALEGVSRVVNHMYLKLTNIWSLDPSFFAGH